MTCTRILTKALGVLMAVNADSINFTRAADVVTPLPLYGSPIVQTWLEQRYWATHLEAHNLQRQSQDNRLFPVYFKMHKTGSGAISRTLRCISYSSPELIPGDGWLANRFTNHSFNPDGVPGCGVSAWEHDIGLHYKVGGSKRVLNCLRPGVRARHLTVLRDPVERVLSSIYFFVKKFCDAPIDGGPVPELTVADLDEIAAKDEMTPSGGFHEYLQIFARSQPTRRGGNNQPEGRGTGMNGRHFGKAARSSQGETPPPLSRTWEKYGGWVKWSSEQIATAKANLEADVQIIGVTESMSSFLVLLALEMGWPLRALCTSEFHVNKERPKAEALPPDTLEYLRKRLAPELELYEHGRALAARRQAAHGERFVEAFAEFDALECNGSCAEEEQRRYRVVQELPAELLPMNEKKNCDPSFVGRPRAIGNGHGGMRGGRTRRRRGGVGISEGGIRGGSPFRNPRTAARHRDGDGNGNVNDVGDGGGDDQDSAPRSPGAGELLRPRAGLYEKVQGNPAAARKRQRAAHSP